MYYKTNLHLAGPIYIPAGPEDDKIVDMYSFN